MSNERQETVADIVAEMRKRAEEVYAGQAGYPESWKDQMNYDEIREIADRIEAAAKREREATPEKSSVVANAMKMREALRGLLEIVCVDCKSSYEIDGKCVKCPRVVAAESALSAPPRNCDVLEGSTADDEFEKAMGFPPSKTADERDAIMRENWFLFKHWLFDEAKGEAHGQK